MSVEQDFELQKSAQQQRWYEPKKKESCRTQENQSKCHNLAGSKVQMKEGFGLTFNLKPENVNKTAKCVRTIAAMTTKTPVKGKEKNGISFPSKII